MIPLDTTPTIIVESNCITLDDARYSDCKLDEVLICKFEMKEAWIKSGWKE
ncbi:MAG: hypothetical protein ACFFDW_04315 [Candidatus Thorarchaeota archaeon]